MVNNAAINFERKHNINNNKNETGISTTKDNVNLNELKLKQLD